MACTTAMLEATSLSVSVNTWSETVSSAASVVYVTLGLLNKAIQCTCNSNSSQPIKVHKLKRVYIRVNSTGMCSSVANAFHVIDLLRYFELILGIL